MGFWKRRTRVRRIGGGRRALRGETVTGQFVRSGGRRAESSTPACRLALAPLAVADRHSLLYRFSFLGRVWPPDGADWPRGKTLWTAISPGRRLAKTFPAAVLVLPVQFAFAAISS